MKTYQELKGLSIMELHIRRNELFALFESESVPEGVKHAAAVIHDRYGAEIDARMAERAHES